jgi:hypothetical protein
MLSSSSFVLAISSSVENVRLNWSGLDDPGQRRAG